MKKMRYLSALAAALLLALFFALAGCSGVYVADIRKIGDGIYIIEYSDGTESSFVLQDGKDGKDGKDGQDGKDGKDGKDGQDGKDGKDGQDGKDGADGLNGSDGADGEDGQDGQDGQDASGVTVEELYEYYCAQYGDITYEEFLQKFLGGGEDADGAVGRTLLSVVKIATEYYETVEHEDGETEDRTNVYNGAGVIYELGEEYTYILTNQHLFVSEYANADNGSDLPRRVVCYLYGSENFPSVKQEDGEDVQEDGYDVFEYGEYAIECEYVGGAVGLDVALIRARTEDLFAINPDVRAVTFAKEYHVGQSVFTVGNPNKEGLSVTRGVISVESEYIDLDIGGTIYSVREMRMDVPIYGGNSGGGLFNGAGELVGLANARRTADQNINFAVPLEVVEGAAANIRAFAEEEGYAGSVLRPLLGVTVTAENARYDYDELLGYGENVVDVTVAAVQEGGLAQRVDLREGDVLLGISFGEEELSLRRLYALGDALLWARPGDVMRIRYRRGDAVYTTAPYTLAREDFSAVE